MGGCGSDPARPTGGYYLDDGPPADPPKNLEDTPDAQPKAEALRTSTAKPYTALGKRFVPMTQMDPYRARGRASWYGRRYHGRTTASGETYDMFSMSAAHPILPIPSYVRVTCLRNGRSVVVRVNDRGPFHSERLIDLSYTAALKLGLVQYGSDEVEVELIIPSQDHSTGSRQMHLQLGAFQSEDNALLLLSRLKNEAPWIAGQLSVTRAGGWFKIMAGPFASRGEALRAADRIGSSHPIEALLSQEP